MSGRLTLASCTHITGRLRALKNCSNRMRLLMALVWGSIFLLRWVTMEIVVTDPMKIEITATKSFEHAFTYSSTEGWMSHQKWNPKQFALRARVYPRPPVLRHRQHHQIRLTSWCLSVEVSMLHNSNNWAPYFTSRFPHTTHLLYALPRGDWDWEWEWGEREREEQLCNSRESHSRLSREGDWRIRSRRLLERDKLKFIR